MAAKQDSFLNTSSVSVFFVGSVLTSFGILMVTVGGSWDITNHLLNKPETFFSPPHAILYAGVAITLVGIVISFFSWTKMTKQKYVFWTSLKFKLVGIALLVGAGPFDFVWHSNFGLDGLLSPPHLTLITGMILCGIGGMIGISRFLDIKFQNNNYWSFLLILAVLPVWLAGSGMISLLSLPFSNTNYFDFNPEPVFASVVATICYPILISISVLIASGLSGYRFGVLTVLGGLFLLIYGSTAIVPNLALFDSIVFYALNFIPFVVADFIVSSKKTKLAVLAAGAILGSVFYLVYYPYVMYTFNEVFLGKLVSPSMIYRVYFELMPSVMLVTIVPAILSGLLGSIVSLRLVRKIQVRVTS